MKSEIVETPEQPKPEKTIDWSNPMVVKSESGTLVLTTGEHSDTSFTGQVINSDRHPIGEYNSSWNKDSFTPIEEPITITFTND